MDRTVKEAFDDLDRRVKARQEERLRDEKERQAMRLKELNAQSGALTKLEAPISASGVNSTVASVAVKSGEVAVAAEQ